MRCQQLCWTRNVDALTVDQRGVNLEAATVMVDCTSLTKTVGLIRPVGVKVRARGNMQDQHCMVCVKTQP